MSDFCYSWPTFNRIFHQVELMDRMMEVIGVDHAVAARVDRGEAWYEARTNCISCCHEWECRNWLECSEELPCRRISVPTSSSSIAVQRQTPVISSISSTAATARFNRERFLSCFEAQKRTLSPAKSFQTAKIGCDS